MSFDDLVNELILHLGHFLPNPSLNSLIQTHKRCAILLTPYLYDPEIRFELNKGLSYDADEEYDYGDPKGLPLRCLDCAPRWKSSLILEYFRAQRKETFTLRDWQKRTLLHRIAERGNTQILDILLTKGSDIETRDHGNSTPLLTAAREGNEPVFRGLLTAGANPRASSGLNITALVQAIFSKDFSMVQDLIELFESRSEDIWAPCTSGEVMHRAVYTGYEPIVRLLIDHGADFSAADEYDTTCLNAAVIWGFGDVVNLLLDRGANVLTSDNMGRTVLTEIGDRLGAATVMRIIRAITESGVDFSTMCDAPLHLYAGSGDLHCVQALIDNGADPLSVDMTGATPLMFTLLNYDRVSSGDCEGACRALIKAMTDVKGGAFPVNSMTKSLEWDPGCDVLGMTALHLAAEVGVDCLVLLLIEARASVLIVDNYGRTPLLCALLNDKESTCLILAEEMRVRGYDFSARVSNSSGQRDPTPKPLLEFATAQKMDRLVQFLDEAGSSHV